MGFRCELLHIISGFFFDFRTDLYCAHDCDSPVILKLSARHVSRIIETFEKDGFAGLEDKRTRPTNHSANQMTLPLFKDVLEIQKDYPRAGKFRVRGLLEKQYQEQGRDEQLPSERTISRVMALNRQFHNAPGPWRSTGLT